MTREELEIKRKDNARRAYISNFKKKYGCLPEKRYVSKWEKHYDRKKELMYQRMNNRDTFGSRLRYVMACKDMKRSHIAENIFVSPSTVTDWLIDETYPSVPSMVALADYMGCSLDYLLRGRKTGLDDWSDIE